MIQHPAPTYSFVLLGSEATLFSHLVQHVCASGSWYNDWATDWMALGSNPGRGKIFFSSKIYRPTKGPTLLPFHWVPGLFPRGKVVRT
jgi:hypothetical protein